MTTRFILSELLRNFIESPEFKFRVNTLKAVGLTKRLAEISAMRSYQDELFNLEDKINDLQAGQSFTVSQFGNEKVKVEKTGDGKKLRIVRYEMDAAGEAKLIEVVRTVSL